MRLSLCMIVKNEANSLPQCLESVKDVVDEIIVLDTGSSDETVSIAQSFDAQVQHFAWNNDFSAARNESLKYATGDWILVLDADERLAKDVAPFMQQAMQEPNALVINLVRKEIGAVQSPYSLVSRLFRKHDAIHFSRPYHAIVDDSVTDLLKQESQWRIIELPKVAILHYGYQPGTIASRNKLEMAESAMASFLANHPHDPYACSKLGALYVQMGQFDRGIKLLEQGLHAVLSPNASSRSLYISPGTSNAPLLFELHYHLGLAYNRIQQPTPAEQHYRLAVQQPILNQLKLGAYNNLGTLLQAKGDLQGAKGAYEACLEIDPNFVTVHYNLGMVLKAMGQLPEAVKQYQKAIDLNPNYAEAYQNLGVALLKLEKTPESMEAFKRAIELHQQHNPQEAARLRQGLKELGFQNF
ncbi:glycosyltransferase [filamentous cyanobacterium CCP1]|nr:glycosyltransferase [filamentous cyanobacterium CCP2]PSB63236.1 glycosyltransferase [filamentous cyanobacterium CCP1]